MSLEIRPYPGFPAYGVTRDGRVYRIVRAPYGRHVPYALKSRPDRQGYRIVGGGTLPTLKVHRMVAETFIPNPRGLPHVAHNDGSKDNNRVENLRWTVPRDNHADKRHHGTLLFGENQPGAKLTAEQVRDARQRAARGESHTSIAASLPVCRSVLSRAIQGKTWTHV